MRSKFSRKRQPVTVLGVEEETKTEGKEWRGAGLTTSSLSCWKQAGGTVQPWMEGQGDGGASSEPEESSGRPRHFFKIFF